MKNRMIDTTLGYRQLAENMFVSNDDFATLLNNNDLIVGGSGCGKTGGYVIPNVLLSQGSLIITDTKGMLYKQLASKMKAKGFKVQLLDFVNPQQSCHYNPLDFIRRYSVIDRNGEEMITYDEQDILKLAHIMIPKDLSRDEQFWVESARTTVTFLIAFTLEALVEEERSMMSFPELFYRLENKMLRKPIENWLDEYPDSISARQYKMISSIMYVDKTWGCIRQFVAEGIQFFNYRKFDMIFGYTKESSLHFKDLGHEKTVLFVNVSDSDRSCDRLADIFYTQALQMLLMEADKQENGRLPVSVRFILDDFAANVKIQDFDKIISIIRSRNISVSIILQNLTQLDAVYNKSQSSTIISNCDHMLYLGGQDLDTANYVGTRANKTRETILAMPFDKAWVMERGKTGMLVNKIQPYKDLYENEEIALEDFILAS